MPDEPNRPNSKHFGYRYQSIVGVLRLIDVLNEKLEKVSFERKEASEDRFDDIKAFKGNTIHHYQVKGSYVQNILGLKDFTRDTRLRISLPRIFLSWANLSKRFPGKQNYFHIYTTKSISESDTLKEFLIKIDDDRTEFSENKDEVYCFSDKILTDETFETVRKEIVDLGLEYKLKDCINNIIIESKQPESSPEIIRSEIISSPAEITILAKIEALGLHLPPQNMNPNLVFTALFNRVNKESVTHEEITKEILERSLQIKQDFDSIKNTIDFDDNQYVSTKNNLELLDEKIKNHSGKILAIYGKPGSGKTWLLTKWRKFFEDKHPKTPPIWHYSSISVTEDEDMEIRITKQTLLNNFMKIIKNRYELNTEERYSVTTSKLQELLNKIGNIAKDNGIVIPVIIDGLDHVERIKKRAHTLAKDEETVFDFLKAIKIPEGICFIFGTQLGIHLDDLKSKYGEDSFFEISGFEKDEIKEYFTKLTVSEEFLESDKIIKILEITDGLPLLVNYVAKSLLQFNDFELVEKIPIIQGDVKKYYDYLWGEELVSKDFTKILAKYLALLEFSSSNEFLEKLYPEQLRDFQPLKDALNPLLPLLRINESDEISIFHDSFREYLLQYSDLADNAKQEYSVKIYDLLIKNGIFENSRTYRYVLKYGLLAKKFDKIIEVVDVNFVDESMFQVRNRHDIQNNIDISIRASFEKQDISEVIVQSLIKKYTIDRFRDLDTFDFDKLIPKVRPEQMSSLLLHDKKLNLTLSETIDYLANGLKNNVDLPYEKILNIWKQTYDLTPSGERNLLPEGISFANYAIVVCFSYGFKRLISFIEANDFSYNLISIIIKSILPFTTYDEIVGCGIKGTKLEPYWTLFLFEILFYYKKEVEFKNHFEKNKEELFQHNTARFKEFLKQSNIDTEEIKKYYNQEEINEPQRYKENISIYQNFEKNLAIAKYSNQSQWLEHYYVKINEKTDSFFKRTMLMIYYNTITFMKKNEDVTPDDIEELSKSLIYMMEYNASRSFDEPEYNDNIFKSYISKIIEQSIQTIISHSDITKQKEFLQNYGKFGSKYMFTSISSDNFLELVTKYSQDKELQSEVIALASKPIPLMETGDMISVCIDSTSLFLSINDTKNALKYFKKVIILSHSYGYRKDSLLFEVLDMFDVLGKNNADFILKKFGIVLTYTEFLDIISDHSGEQGIPVDTINKMLKYNSTASLKSIQEYGVDSYRFPEVIKEFCTVKIECNPILRYYLLKTILFESNYNTNNNDELFETKLGIISSLIGVSQILAKHLAEDLRNELQQDFSSVTKMMETKFNQLSTILEIQSIQLKYTISKKEPKSSEPIPIFDTPEKYYEEFEKHHGWSPGHYQWYGHLLEKSYELDPGKTNLLICGGFSERCITHEWEVIGMVETYAKFLANTNQTLLLETFSNKVQNFLHSLFRERNLDAEHDFSWLECFAEEDNPNKVGFMLLFEQLDCSDVEVSRKAYSSIVKCLELGVPSMLDWSSEKLFDDSTTYWVKERLSGIFDTYVTNKKINSESIQKIIQYLESTDYFNFKNTANHMKEQLKYE